MIGWAAFSPVSTRPVYRGVVKHSVYVAAAARGRAVGTTLLTELIDAADDAGSWTIQASIFPENTRTHQASPCITVPVSGGSVYGNASHT